MISADMYDALIPPIHLSECTEKGWMESALDITERLKKLMS